VRRQRVQQLEVGRAQILGQVADEGEAGRDLLLRRAPVDGRWRTMVPEA
jgi:hypothetical protein